MKKFLFASAAAVMLATPVAAQTADTGIWKNNKGIVLGIITHQSLKWEEGPIKCQYNSNYGFSLSNGTTYLWPAGEGWAGNRIKVGVSTRWFDISYVNYSDKIELKGLTGSRGYDDFDPSDYWYDDDEEIDFDLGVHQLHMGVGVGPAVDIAPFGDKTNQLKYLRANLYCHFNPSVSAVIYKDGNGDTNASWAFVPAVDYGLEFQWRFIVLGVEGRWGTAKYKTIFSGDEEDYDISESGISYKGSDNKIKFTNASFRINIGFRW